MSQDAYQEVTDRILELWEAGEATGDDWLVPWAMAAGEGLPVNVSTGRPYRGSNILLCWATAVERGYVSNQWGTVKQWNNQGLKVMRRPEDWPRNRLWGSRIVWTSEYLRKLREGEDPTGDDVVQTDKGPRKKSRALKLWTVFNGEQVEGYERPEVETLTELERIEEGDRYVAATGAKIKWGGAVAAYTPHNDLIRLPRMERYEEIEPFYSTSAHELAHWSGHHDRLDRATLYTPESDVEGCAFEELVAELSAAFQCARLGIEPRARTDHAEYVAHWVKRLRDDKKAIVSAASKASDATDFLFDLAGEPVEREEVAA